GRHQVAVDQIHVRFGEGSDHNHQSIDIGCDGFQVAVGVGSHQGGLAWQHGHHYTQWIAIAPDYPVAGDQRPQIGAEMTAFGFALGFNQHLGAKVRDDQPVAFGPQVALAQLLLGGDLPFGGADATLLLNFGNAPALAASEFALTHRWTSVLSLTKP